MGRSSGEGIGYPLQYSWASLVAQLTKNSPAMHETCVQPWIGEIPWIGKIPTPVFWPGEFHGLYGPWVHKDSDTTEQLSLSLSFPPVYRQNFLGVGRPEPAVARSSPLRAPLLGQEGPCPLSVVKNPGLDTCPPSGQSLRPGRFHLWPAQESWC